MRVRYSNELSRDGLTDVCFEVFSRETNLDEPLLLHEDIVRDIVDNVLAKDRGGQMLKQFHQTKMCYEGKENESAPYMPLPR
jgi:hypothetical protein